jgi:EpsI family protein
VIFAYLVWDRRAAFKHDSLPSPWGALTFLSALLVGALGIGLGEPFISRISLVVALIGLFQLFLGTACLKRLAFPLAYLFLLIPPPYAIVKEVSYHLRMFDARIATSLVQAVGVPVYQDAYFMHLPEITLEVADVCSGIASLFAMIALGTIYVYYLPARPAAKVLVLAGAIICPLVANLFRLFLVAVSVYYYGPVMLGAFFHSFTGTFTFVLSLLMFLWLGETMRRKYPERHDSGHQPEIDRARSERTFSLPARFPLFGSIIGAIAGIGLLFYSASAPSGGSGKYVRLEQIPARLDNFTTLREAPSEGYNDSRAEQSLSRVYASKDQPVELFVGFSSRQANENRLQSPKLVFPKHWEYASMEGVQLDTADGQKIDAIELLTKKNEEKMLVMFWYQVRGKEIASDLRNRIELAKNSLLYGRTDGAVVRLATPVARFESLQGARARLSLFARSLYPELRRVLPD